jgi:hypothetical protein
VSAVYLWLWTVTCARCGRDWTEGADGVTHRDGDWWCRFEEDCDSWLTEARYGDT